jgi:hypothetical protein
MEKWFVPAHMKQLVNTTVPQFGVDNTGNVIYSFDSRGFRSENYNGRSLNVIGNSLSFGIGLNHQYTFASKLAHHLDLNLNNCSFGCYLHENHDHLQNLNTMIQRDSDDIFLIQINNLDRRRDEDVIKMNVDPNWAVKRFLEYFEQVREICKNHHVIYVYWDNTHYSLPSSVIDEISIYNKFHIDQSLPTYPDTFGLKSHQAISRVLCCLLDKNK